MKSVHLELYRNYFRETYTIGKLFIEDDYFCDTLEPSKFGDYPFISSGNYVIRFDIVSPKYKNRHPYKTLCHGKVPRLMNVPNRSGILIHIGNECTYTKQDTKGCILVGRNTQVGKVMNSTRTFTSLYKILINYDVVTITIVNLPLDNHGYNP